MLQSMKFAQKACAFTTMGQDYQTVIDLNTQEVNATEYQLGIPPVPNAKNKNAWINKPIAKLEKTGQLGASCWAVQFTNSTGTFTSFNAQNARTSIILSTN
jgi:hypothetical protein